MVFRRIGNWISSLNWKKVGVIAAQLVPLVLIGGSTVFAASSIPTVQYGTGNAVATTVNTALENIAATIRDVLGGTALVAILVAAIVNHFVHDARAKDRAKEIIASAIVGLLIAAFAPQIVNWFASL